MEAYCLTVGELAKHSHEEGNWIWAVSSNFNTGSYNISGATNGNAIEYINVPAHLCHGTQDFAKYLH